MFVFSTGRLAVPTQDMDLQARHVSFFAPGGVLQMKRCRDKKDIRFAGLAASNGRRREK